MKYYKTKTGTEKYPFETVDKALLLPLTREVANAKHLTEGENA